jgi:hypothetical protein
MAIHLTKKARDAAKLQQEAADAATKAEAAIRDVRAEQARAQQRRQQRQEEYDRRQVEEYDPATWDVQFREAERMLANALAEQPWVQPWVELIALRMAHYDIATEAKTKADNMGSRRHIPTPATTGSTEATLVSTIARLLETQARARYGDILDEREERRLAFIENDDQAADGG